MSEQLPSALGPQGPEAVKRASESLDLEGEAQQHLEDIRREEKLNERHGIEK